MMLSTTIIIRYTVFYRKTSAYAVVLRP